MSSIAISRELVGARSVAVIALFVAAACRKPAEDPAPTTKLTLEQLNSAFLTFDANPSGLEKNIASYTALLGPPHAIAGGVRIWYGTGPSNGTPFPYLCYEVTLRPDNTGGLGPAQGGATPIEKCQQPR
jgi:hypothetical protein